jgi:hypothetical protein
MCDTGTIFSPSSLVGRRRSLNGALTGRVRTRAAGGIRPRIKPSGGGGIKTEKVVSIIRNPLLGYLKLGKERGGKCKLGSSRKIYENEMRRQQNILKGSRGKTRTPTSICVIGSEDDWNQSEAEKPNPGRDPPHLILPG